MNLLVVIPTYGQLDYGVEAARTALTHTPGCTVLVVDDCSPEWNSFDKKRFPTGTRFHRFGKNGGLTRSWNLGLRVARDEKFEFACCTNSDVLFTPSWADPLVWATGHGAHLVGPLTNAPGHQAKQQVKRHLPDFVVRDDPAYLAEQAQKLSVRNRFTFTEMRLNGFCLFARTDVWWAGAFSPTDVFNPKFKLTKNEDELQGRWLKAGRVCAMVPTSFVFHYRGVTRKGATRGREGKGWYRKK